MFRIFTRHNDQHGKCKFVLASESGKFKEEGTGGHFPALYHLWYVRGTAAYFIFEVFQNLLAEWASVPRFPHLEYTISFCGTGEETLKQFIYGQSDLYIEFSEWKFAVLSRLRFYVSSSQSYGRRSQKREPFSSHLCFRAEKVMLNYEPSSAIIKII